MLFLQDYLENHPEILEGNMQLQMLVSLLDWGYDFSFNKIFLSSVDIIQLH